MSRIAVVFFFVAVLISTPKSWAWGCQGHQSVAFIAYANLNATAKKAVNDLLSTAQQQYTTADGKKITRYCSPTKLGKIEYFATWADDARDVMPNTGAWHFWDIPLATSSATFPQFCSGDGCVVKALHDELAILVNSSSTHVEKQQALLFIIHLMGDLHQPMHIVDNGDRGGNCVPVSFQYPGYTASTKAVTGGSYDPNLHSIWDTNMIAVYSGDKKGLTAAGRDTATQKWASKISTAYAEDIAREKKQKFNLSDTAMLASWAIDAHSLAGSNSYSKMPTAIPVDPNPTTLPSCSGVSDRFLALHETADKTFIKNAEPVIEKQVALAGARLAAILNTAWQ